METFGYDTYPYLKDMCYEKVPVLKSKPKLELGLTAYEELFMKDKQLPETRLATIYEIALTKVSTK